MAKRDTWEFPVPKETLQEAVARKAGHHTERLQHWMCKEHEAEQDLRANGIDMRDAATLSFNNAPSTAYHQEPVLHQEKVAALREAQGKVREHRVALDGYQRWERALALERGPTLFHLDVGDLTYFGL